MSDRTASKRENAISANRAAYDELAARRAPLCRPASDADLVDPLPTVDPLGWLGPTVVGKQLLCLAAGGGRQSMIYAVAGARVTVVDVSPAMLQLDRQAAAQRGLTITTIEASMDAMPMLSDAAFDLVVHPVSTCYLPDIQAVFREVARVLRPGGVYVSQHKQPTSLQASTVRIAGNYAVVHPYYRTQPIPTPPQETTASLRLRERDAIEYLHRWEQIVGGICRSGFVIEDLVEPVHVESGAKNNSFADRAQFIAPYVRIKARRQQAATGPRRPQLIL